MKQSFLLNRRRLFILTKFSNHNNSNEKDELYNMKIENLEVGKLYNYNSLCNTLGISKKQGEYKKLQIAEINRYVRFGMSHNFYVAEIYEYPLSLEEVFESGLPLPKYKPISQSHGTSITLYTELLKDKNLFEATEFDKMLRIDTKRYWWKCYSCKSVFYASPRERFKYPFKLADESLNCHCCKLSKNARSTLDFLSNENIKTVLEYEFRDLIGLGGKPLRFDFAIFNKNDDLVALIEYDGQYHDEKLNPDYENYLYVRTHDERKNEYCRKNNIPLLRIHHSEFKNYITLIEEFFKELNIYDQLFENAENKIKTAYLKIIERINGIETFNNTDYDAINKINNYLDYRDKH